MIKKGVIIHYLVHQILTKTAHPKLTTNFGKWKPHRTKRCTTNSPEQTLTQEQKLILRNSKRILNSEKTTLPSLRNIKWRIVKAETNKVN